MRPFWDIPAIAAITLSSAAIQFCFQAS